MTEVILSKDKRWQRRRGKDILWIVGLSKIGRYSDEYYLPEVLLPSTAPDAKVQTGPYVRIGGLTI